MKTRNYMMKQLEQAWGIRFVSTTEEFNGSQGGVWLSGENGDTDPLDGGMELFDYYSENYSRYEFGVFLLLQSFLLLPFFLLFSQLLRQII